MRLILARILGVEDKVAMVRSAVDWATKAMPLEKSQKTDGVPRAQAYNITMYIMAEPLVVGFLANFCVKAFDKRHHMKSEVHAEIEPARAQTAAGQA